MNTAWRRNGAACFLPFFVFLALLFLTQRWLSFDEGIKALQSKDSQDYIKIAEYAKTQAFSIHQPVPHFRGLSTHIAYRFLFHALVGHVSEWFSISLGKTYWFFASLLFFGIFFGLWRIFFFLGLSRPLKLFLFAIFLSNPYLLRFYLVAPAMGADLIFVLASVWVLVGLIEQRPRVVTAALVFGLLGRQTAAVLTLGAAAWLRMSPGWKRVSALDRSLWIALWVSLSVVIYGALQFLVLPFSEYSPIPLIIDLPRVIRFEWPNAPFRPLLLKILADHFFRCLLPLMMPLAVVLAVCKKRSASAYAKLSALFFLLVIAQPLLTLPTWTKQNQGRLVSLALPAILVAVAYLIKDHGYVFRRYSSYILAFLCVFLGSLHHVVSSVPLTALQFGGLAFVASGGLFFCLRVNLWR